MSRRAAIVGLFLNGIGALSGTAGIVCFAIFQNKIASLFGLVTLSYSLLNIMLHVLYLWNRLQIYTASILKDIKCFAVCSIIVLFGVFLYVIFLLFYWQIPFNEPISSNLIITAVWVFLSLKYAYLLCRSSSHYCNILISSSSPLLES